MSDAERRLVEDRTTRNAARKVFEGNVAQVKADLAARSIPERLADKARRDVTDALATGLDVARESKGIVAGMAALLGAWFFRASLISALGRLFGKNKPARVQDAATSQDGEFD